MFRIKFLILIVVTLIGHYALAQQYGEIGTGAVFKDRSEILSETEQPIFTVSHAKPVTRELKEDHRGLAMGSAIGFGFSTHASSYSINVFPGQLREFSGFRMIVLDSRIGWGIHKNIVVYGTWKFAPANSPISPYQSHYLGGSLAYYLPNSSPLFFLGGLGKYWSRVAKDQMAGEGMLVNIGMGVKISNHVACELTILTGKMEPGDLDPNPFNPGEFNISFGMGYLF